MSLRIKTAYLYIVTAFPTKSWSRVESFQQAVEEQRSSLLSSNCFEKMKYYPSGESFEVAGNAEAKGCSLLENYALLDDKRLSLKYRYENAFLRLQLAPWVCECFSPEVMALGERVVVEGGVLTLFCRGVGMVTWKVRVEESEVKPLVLCHRKGFRSMVESRMTELLQTYISLPKVFSLSKGESDKQERDTFFLTVARDLGFRERKILDYVQEKREEFYSLNSGLDFHGNYVSPRSHEKFWESNLSTRDDTFFTLNFRHALIVESSWKHCNFTASRFKEGASQSLLRSREEYNDLNYLIWIEVMFYQRYLLKLSYEVLARYDEAPIEQRSVFEILTLHEKVNALIANLQASQITVFETYQDWIEYGKKAMQIDSCYRIFCERIKRIDNSIQTKYHFEQITKQNRLAEIGIWISKLGLFFCALEVMETLFDSLKEAGTNVYSFEWITYSIFVFAFVTYLVRSSFYFKEDKTSLS